MRCAIKNTQLSDKAEVSDLPLVVYDLRSSVASYDLLTTLYQHEVHIQKLGNKHFDFVLYNPPDEFLQMGDKYDKLVDCDQRQARVERLLMPIASHYRAILSAKCIRSAAELSAEISRYKVVLPRGYSAKNYPALLQSSVFKSTSIGKMCMGIAADESDLNKFIRWRQERLGDQKYLTFTLRDYGHHPSRNLILSEIEYLFPLLSSAGIAAVIIPDADSTTIIPDSNDYIVCPPASHDLGFRLALYESAITNIATPSGPMMAVAFDHLCKGIQIKSYYEDPNCPTGHDRELYRFLGVDIGTQHLSYFGVEIIWDYNFSGPLTEVLKQQLISGDSSDA